MGQLSELNGKVLSRMSRDTFWGVGVPCRSHFGSRLGQPQAESATQKAESAMSWSSKASRSWKARGSCGSSEPWEEPWEEWEGRPSSPRAQPTWQHDRPVQKAESAMSCSKTSRSWQARGSGSSDPWEKPWKEWEDRPSSSPRALLKWHDRPEGSLEWIQNMRKGMEHIHKKAIYEVD